VEGGQHTALLALPKPCTAWSIEDTIRPTRTGIVLVFAETHQVAAAEAHFSPWHLSPPALTIRHGRWSVFNKLFQKINGLFPGCKYVFFPFYYETLIKCETKTQTEIYVEYNKLWLSGSGSEYVGRAGVRYLPMCLSNFMNDRLIAGLHGWGLQLRGTRRDCNTDKVACVSSVPFHKVKSGVMNPILDMRYELWQVSCSGAAIRHQKEKRSLQLGRSEDIQCKCCLAQEYMSSMQWFRNHVLTEITIFFTTIFKKNIFYSLQYYELYIHTAFNIYIYATFLSDLNSLWVLLQLFCFFCLLLFSYCPKFNIIPIK